jgi:uncharacterized protein
MIQPREAAENIAVVRGFLAAFTKGDLDGVREALDPNVEVVQPPTLPYGGSYLGKDGFLDLAGRLADAWEFPRPPEPRCFGLDDGRVLVYAQFDVISRATRRAFCAPIVELYTVKDSKLTRVEVLTDTAAALEALRA